MSIFFDSDFEGGTFAADGWTSDPPANNPPTAGTLEISTELARTGMYCCKGYFDNINGSSYQPSIARAFPNSTHVFMRYYFRESVGFVTGSNGYSKRIRYTGVGGNPNIWTLTLNGAAVSGQGQYSIGVEAPYDGRGITEVVTVGTRNSERDNIVLFSGVNPSQTSWDLVETEILFNTPGLYNGVMRMWINGTLRIEMINVALVGPTTSSYSLGFPQPPDPNAILTPSNLVFNSALIFIQSGLGQIYYDRIAVGDARIGAAGGDTTPPAAPTGVTVS